MFANPILRCYRPENASIVKCHDARIIINGRGNCRRLAFEQKETEAAPTNSRPGKISPPVTTFAGG